MNFNTSCEIVALEWNGHTLTQHQLDCEVDKRAQWIISLGCSRIALLMDNCIEWVLFDLACLKLKVCLFPVPLYFSEQQLSYSLEQSGSEVLICGDSLHHNNPTQPSPFNNVSFLFTLTPTPTIPEGTIKITFTSGSTGNPKGVCLGIESIENVTNDLCQSIQIDNPIHLCLLPLPTLLENIAGVYGPLLANGKVVLAGESERGFSGSKLARPQQLLKLISEVQPNSIILVPELLMLLTMAAQQGWQVPRTLIYIAVGGAKVASELLETARNAGLPVYQGYGLSECSSVVAINRPNTPTSNSVGHLLPNQDVIIKNSEIIVKKNLFLGYVNDPQSFFPSEVKTGDLGYFEQEKLVINGRIKNLIINSFGRNISPEWIESTIMTTGCFSHVIVYGDSQPVCIALLVLLKEQNHQFIQQALDNVNASLPDYGQVKAWTIIPSLLTTPDLLTSTGKIKRDVIFEHYNAEINALYNNFEPKSLGIE